MKKTTLKDIQTIVADKNIIENLDYSLFKKNYFLVFLLFGIGFLEPLFILFTFFFHPLEPVGDYAIFKILLFYIFIFSRSIINNQT